MSKLMMVVGLLAAFVISNPQAVFERLGPEASLVGGKIKGAFDVGLYVPTLRRAGL